MKERPILMSGEMVRAILDGRKTMTRRVINPQPVLTDGSGFSWKGMLFGRGSDERETAWNFSRHSCPYGKIGDRLYARLSGVITQPYSPDHEGPWITFQDCSQKFFSGDFFKPSREPENNWWKKQGRKLTPSIHTPKWASPVTVEITNIRVERLQDISEEDAEKEGVDISHLMHEGGFVKTAAPPYRTAFAGLWNKINGKKHPWSGNSWVWVIGFKRVQP